MKKQSRKVVLGAATVAAMMGSAQLANAATDAMPMTAKIIAAITISATQALNFGTATETGAGTIVIKTDGSRTVGGGVTAIGATNQEGQFKISAAGGVAFQVTAPAKATLTETVGGTKTMTAAAFRFGTASGTKLVDTFTGVGVKTGKYGFGGTLTVNAAQATGTYKGTVTLTAVYQ